MGEAPEIMEGYRRFGVLIKEGRARTGMSQDTLAQAVGLSRVSIANIEHGKHRTLLHHAYFFCCLFGIEMKDLFPRPSVKVGVEWSK